MLTGCKCTGCVAIGGVTTGLNMCTMLHDWNECSVTHGRVRHGTCMVQAWCRHDQLHLAVGDDGVLGRMKVGSKSPYSMIHS